MSKLAINSLLSRFKMQMVRKSSMVLENRAQNSTMDKKMCKSICLVAVPKNWAMDSSIKSLKLMLRKLLTSLAPIPQLHTSSEETISNLLHSYQENPKPQVLPTSTKSKEVGNS